MSVTMSVVRQVPRDARRWPGPAPLPETDARRAGLAVSWLAAHFVSFVDLCFDSVRPAPRGYSRGSRGFRENVLWVDRLIG